MHHFFNLILGLWSILCHIFPPIFTLKLKYLTVSKNINNCYHTSMTDAEVVAKTAEFIKEKFTGDSTGHDWRHMYRVWQLAKKIAAHENNPNMLVVELGALLHDIA